MSQVPAIKLLVNGLVQGVGFRPTVSKIANAMNLSGWVKNTSFGVEIVLLTTDKSEFLERLEASIPRLASLDSVECENIQVAKSSGFRIIESESVDINSTIISSDSYVCPDCLNDIFDVNSRFYLYPFTNCTNCGPRYTVINDLPYDRQKTALAPFTMCAECQHDYEDIESRRYHAQASSCPNCGPAMDTDFRQITDFIRNGKIVALKGVGGYVLLADAKNNEAVAKLRVRKKRKSKPFATLALNVASVKKCFANVSEHEDGLLESPGAPIVVLGQKKDTLIAPEVAPALSNIGIMLPNSPIHYILMYYLLNCPVGNDWLSQANDILLIATSANVSGGAIISSTKNVANLAELELVADLIVGYNRDIAMRIDDSVIMALSKYDILLRRARGFVPKPYYFKYELPEVLGVGADLKNSLTFIRDNKAFVSQYIGDMKSVATIEYFNEVYNHFRNIYDFQPKLVVSDLHPDFYTTQFAASLAIPHIQLQHHIAHFASVIANAESYHYQINEKVLGCILDGYGYGESSEALGGELIEYTNSSFEFQTISQFMPLTVPGGDIAEKEPWRIVVAYCVENYLAIPEHLLSMPQLKQVIELTKRKQFGQTNACGRYFSMIASLLNIVNIADYEAHAAMLLESMVTTPEISHDFVRLDVDGRPDFYTLFNHIYQIGITEQDVQRAVNIFFGSFRALIEKWIVFHCSMRNIRQVAVSGGCWQSKYLLSELKDKLKPLGIKLLTPYQMSMNDEAISFGQAWYGAQLLLRGKI